MITTEIKCYRNGFNYMTLGPIQIRKKIVSVRLDCSPSNEFIPFQEWIDNEDSGVFQMPVISAIVRDEKGREYKTFAKTWTCWDEKTKIHYVQRLGLGAYGDSVAIVREMLKLEPRF